MTWTYIEKRIFRCDVSIDLKTGRGEVALKNPSMIESPRLGIARRLRVAARNFIAGLRGFEVDTRGRLVVEHLRLVPQEIERFRALARGEDPECPKFIADDRAELDAVPFSPDALV